MVEEFLAFVPKENAVRDLWGWLILYRDDVEGWCVKGDYDGYYSGITPTEITPLNPQRMEIKLPDGAEFKGMILIREYCP